MWIHTIRHHIWNLWKLKEGKHLVCPFAPLGFLRSNWFVALLVPPGFFFDIYLVYSIWCFNSIFSVIYQLQWFWSIYFFSFRRSDHRERIFLCPQWGLLQNVAWWRLLSERYVYFSSVGLVFDYDMFEIC